MKEIKLFDYQEDMKSRIEKALRLHRSVMAQMPTGTGKTVLLASVVESFLREHSNCNVWIVAHRRELVSQIRETIERIFSKTHPSSLTLKGGSTSIPKPLSPQGTGDVTARCAEFFESPRPSLAKEGSTAFSKPLFSLRRLAALGIVQTSLALHSFAQPFPSGDRGCNRPPVLRTATL